MSLSQLVATPRKFPIWYFEIRIGKRAGAIRGATNIYPLSTLVEANPLHIWITCIKTTRKRLILTSRLRVITPGSEYRILIILYSEPGLGSYNASQLNDLRGNLVPAR